MNNTEYIKKESKIIINILKTIGLIFLLLIWNYIPLSILKRLFNIDYNSFSIMYKVIYLLCCDLVLILFLILVYRKTLIKDFKSFFNKKFPSNIGKSLTYWAVGLTIMITSNILITVFSPNSVATNEEAVRKLIDTAPLFMLFELSIYAPITEELIFRKSIKDIINNKYIYILLSGIIFGGMHMLSSFSNPIDLLYIIPYSTLGITFASLYHKTDNIFSTITVHALHNTLTLVLYLISTILV